VTPERPAAPATDTDRRRSTEGDAGIPAAPRSSLLRDPAQPDREAPRRRGFYRGRDRTMSLDVWARAVTDELRRAGREPHQAEVAALLYERIERLPAPRTREMLLRAALMRVVREVTSA
jgi:hypothetical protein